MKKVFISQPMNGLTDEQIFAERERISREVAERLGEEVEIIDSYIDDYPPEDTTKTIPVWYLGKSLELLAEADVAYFGGDWANARGCNIEHETAVTYGTQVIEE